MSKTLDDILVTEMRELRIDARGHAVYFTEYKLVEDENYTDQWGGHSYGVKWSKITGQFRVDTFRKDGSTSLMSFTQPSSCGNCGEYIGYELVGDVAVTKTECQYPDGITTVVEIDVLSGRLICDDDLRDVEIFDDIEGEAGYNSTLGQAQVVEASAKVGLAYGPCLNTSPSLCELEPGKYIVANPEYDDETNEPVRSLGKAVANFCTDLWAFSMADYEVYLAAGGTSIEEDDHHGTRSVVDVPPGRYRMTYHGGEKHFDAHDGGEIIFAEFEKIS